MIRNFENGLKEIRHFRSEYSGRCFFAELDGSHGLANAPEVRTLVMLRIFRKEGQATPAREINLARARLDEFVRKSKSL